MRYLCTFTPENSVLLRNRGICHEQKGETMNNETRKTSTTAAASPLTVKEAEQPDIVKKIYRVKIHFSETSKETMSDKIKRLILNDCERIS